MEALYNEIFKDQIDYIKSLSDTKNFQKILEEIPPTTKDIILYDIFEFDKYRIMTISLSKKSQIFDKFDFEYYYILKKGSKVLPYENLSVIINK